MITEYARGFDDGVAIQLRVSSEEIEKLKKHKELLQTDNDRLSREHSLNLFTIGQLRADKARLVQALDKAYSYVARDTDTPRERDDAEEIWQLLTEMNQK